MTDHELVLELCKRLDLLQVCDENDVTCRFSVENNGVFFCDDGDKITIGCGSEGYSGFFVRFIFTPTGKIIRHEVRE